MPSRTSAEKTMVLNRLTVPYTDKCYSAPEDVENVWIEDYELDTWTGWEN